MIRLCTPRRLRIDVVDTGEPAEVLQVAMLAVANSLASLEARTIGRRLTTHSSFSFFARPRGARHAQGKCLR